MGLFKALRAVKGLGAMGSPDGQRPASVHAGLEALGGMMMGLSAPLMVMMAPERGRPLPGTEPAALAALAALAAPPAPGAPGAGDSSSLAAGLAGIAARDSAFDQGLFTTFADQVFAAVVAVWSSNDPGPVRGVLADDLWEPLAAAAAYGQSLHQANPSSMGILQLAALQEGRATLANAFAGAWYDAALVAFEVRLGEGAPPVAREPWAEEWLFQRSAQSGGDPMARPEHCPTCGSPTQVDQSGACTRCRVVMPVLTSGWLVSRIHCHNPFLEAQY
ncbi:MAG: hypothetical protein ACRDZ8_16435, partial [Acidimicrobiales bacterium]